MANEVNERTLIDYGFGKVKDVDGVTVWEFKSEEVDDG
jgi:UDP-N-acetylglucosamine transferase subunit ALG13